MEAFCVDVDVEIKYQTHACVSPMACLELSLLHSQEEKSEDSKTESRQNRSGWYLKVTLWYLRPLTATFANRSHLTKSLVTVHFYYMYILYIRSDNDSDIHFLSTDKMINN